MIALETDRLYLKILDENSYRDVTNYYKRNKDFLKKWSTHKRDDFFSEDYQRSLLVLEKSEIANGKKLKFWIYHKESNELIGFITFGSISRGAFESSILRFKLDKGHTGKGYMTEALNKALDYYFNVLKLHRIEVNVMPTNVCAIKVLEKLRFNKEGTSEKYLKKNGRWEDHTRYAIIKENYDKI